MKKTLWILFPVLCLWITACGSSSQTEVIPTVVLDSGSTGASKPVSTSDGTVVASAEVRPVDSVDLSFPLLGSVRTVEVQVGDRVTAGQVMATLDPVLLNANVAEAEANVLAAETQVRYLRRVGASQEQIDAAQSDVERANAIVNRANATLAQASMAAPIDGTVVSVDIAPGEVANPGQVVIVIADLSDMRIKTTDLSERDIPAVSIGQRASVVIDALDDTFEGQVVDIARKSETIGGDVVYEVTIALDAQPTGIRWGMSAEVEIQTEP